MSDLSFQDLFVPSEGTYLLNHSVGRPLRSTRQAWSDFFLEPWEDSGDDVWPKWLEQIDVFRRALGLLLNAPHTSFCPQVNLSAAFSSVLQSLPIAAPRRTVLYGEWDFPSMGYVIQQAERLGYQPRCLEPDLDLRDPQVWAEQLSDDVALVLVTHVQSNTGLQVPVAEITASARERGILSLVDIAQSVGCVPIDLAAWQADFVVGSCVKWLCGGPGAGFLWVESTLIDRCKPIDVGWFSHEDPFEFNIHDFRYAGDALRFWGGTPSVQPYVIAANSIQELNRIGINTIRAHNLRLTDQILDAVDAASVVSPRDGSQRGGTVVLAFPEPSGARILQALREQKVLFDERPTGIRLSPHIYNSEEEIRTVASCLAASA